MRMENIVDYQTKKGMEHGTGEWSSSAIKVVVLLGSSKKRNLFVISSFNFSSSFSVLDVYFMVFCIGFSLW